MIVDVAIAPADGAADQATDVAVTATFSTVSASATTIITEPTEWMTHLLLQKDAAGDNACTSISYDSSTKIVTCTHADLEIGSSYTVTVTGLLNEDGVTIPDQTAAFTTTSTISVSSITKTSVTADEDGDGAIEFYFTFNSAVPAGVTPTVAVTASGDPIGLAASVSKTISTDTCTFNASRTICGVNITGLDSCLTWQDYLVTVSGAGITTYATYFNSSDDEFDSSATLDGNLCWIAWEDKIISGDTIADYGEVADGKLTITLAGDTYQNLHYYKTIDQTGSAEDFAVSYALSTLTVPSSGSGTAIFEPQIQPSSGNGYDQITIGYVNGDGLDFPSVLIMANSDDDANSCVVAASAGTDIQAIRDEGAPLYLCLVRYNGVLAQYLSGDGETWTQFAAADFEVISGDCTSSADAIENNSADFDPAEVTITVDNNVSGSTAVFSLDYVRFRASGITGTSSADCPAF